MFKINKKNTRTTSKSLRVFLRHITRFCLNYFVYEIMSANEEIHKNPIL